MWSWLLRRLVVLVCVCDHLFISSYACSAVSIETVENLMWWVWKVVRVARLSPLHWTCIRYFKYTAIGLVYEVI